MIQNISIRVPWSDNKWCGRICDCPQCNFACQCLTNISKNKDTENEKELKGLPIYGHEKDIPCLSEGIAFMSEEELKTTTIHPYHNYNTHNHFKDTEQVYPPYSLPARPFLWTMKGPHDTPKTEFYEKYSIDYDNDREPIITEPHGNWVQEAGNQRAIFNRFFRDVKPQESIVFCYAKQVPFIEDNRRIVVAIGLVNEVIPSVEYNHDGSKPLRSVTWETMVRHTIREDGTNGFLIPYDKISKYADKNPAFDIEKATIAVSDEYRAEFSYAAEQVSHDGTIEVLLQAINVFKYIKNFPDISNEIPCDIYLDWLRKRLNKVWDDRGAYPGLGEMFYAFDIKQGLDLAEEIKDYIKKENVSLRIALDKLFNNELTISSNIKINSIICDTWNSFEEEDKKLFILLSRFNLESDILAKIFYEEKRHQIDENWSITDILENPYSIYEKTRFTDSPISVKAVDMAIFPVDSIRERYPLVAPSNLSDGTDKRRIRALLVSFLEDKSARGYSFYPSNLLLNEFENLPLDPPCNINSRNLKAIKKYLENELFIFDVKKENENTEVAYQLNRLHIINELIETKVKERINNDKKLNIQANWSELVSNRFKTESEEALKEDEIQAREEKSVALQMLANSHISVLNGGAGTGKTSVVSILCGLPEIEQQGLLLLAPTGKARVRMIDSMKDFNGKYEAKTVAQFLMSTGQYNYKTMTYQLTNKIVPNHYGTAIIDESSMLTEEMFACLLEALDNIERIIFVGDVNQLPPIGTGCPFNDLVNYLSKDIDVNLFPRVSHNYAELQIVRRQNGQILTDLQLANCFKNKNNIIDDDLFDKLANNTSDRVQIKEWTDPDDLSKQILETLQEIIPLNSKDDVGSFNLSLGANKSKEYYYYNLGCAEAVDNWQILTPRRNVSYGVSGINELIHNTFRKDFMDLAQNTDFIPKPYGLSHIVYGDKVICTVNTPKKASYSHKSVEPLNYIANGEVGITSSVWRKHNGFLNVEFSSQPNVSYGFRKKDFSSEFNETFELAYALTIHKSQGSQFNKVILVISEPCPLLSKELLYTAMTRQVDKLVILYNGDINNLLKYKSQVYSEIAQRYTKLFQEVPTITKFGDKYYNSHLICKTSKGLPVRSKAEIIIAELLDSNGINFEYEKPLVIDGETKLPDFTIYFGGTEYYWEHCGMMAEPTYRRKWENKYKWYEKHNLKDRLITTKEFGTKDFDAQAIQKIIDEKFKR